MTSKAPPSRKTRASAARTPTRRPRLAAELVTRAYAQSFFKDASVKIVTARGGNVIGGGDYAADRIVPDIVRAAAKNERPVLRMPHATRPWQHVLDCLHGYLTYVDALERGETLPDTLNFGPDPTAPITVSELTEEMLKALGRDARYEHEPADSREMHVLAVELLARPGASRLAGPLARPAGDQLDGGLVPRRLRGKRPSGDDARADRRLRETSWIRQCKRQPAAFAAHR